MRDTGNQLEEQEGTPYYNSKQTQIKFVHFAAMAHTILLIQPTKKAESRTFSDYESINECLEGICKIYEEHLKRENPNSPSITYDISQLFDFVDQFRDLSCLVFQKSSSTYCPRNKDWIKEKIYIMLRKQAESK